MATLKEKLISLGVDYDTTLERFVGDESFYLDFLFEFTQDEHIHILEKALLEKDLKTAFHAAHTFKGLAGNFGFEKTLKDIFPLVELLRSDTLEGSEEYFLPLKEAHQELCDIILTYRNKDTSS